MIRYLCLFLGLVALAWPLKADTPSDPVGIVREYYHQLSQRDYIGAYALRSDHSKKSLSSDRFLEIWRNNAWLRARDFKLQKQDGGRATVTFLIKSLDFDLGTGQREWAEYSASADLVREGHGWAVEEIRPKKLSSTPVTGPEFSPDQQVIAGAHPDPLPEDIPVYPGFTMSQPLLVKGSQSPQGVRMVVSLNRQKKVHPIEVFQWYEKALKPAGWVSSGPAGGSGALGASFTKGSRKVFLAVYNSLFGGTDEAADPRGVRLDIEY